MIAAPGEQASGSAGQASLRSELVRGAALCAIACALGAAAWLSLPLWGELDPKPFFNHSIFYYLFARNEPAGLLASFAVVALVWLLASRLSAQRLDGWLDTPARRLSWVVAAVVFALTLAGHYAVTQRFPLAMDEYMPGFQAEIFRAGQLRAQLPPDWRGLIRGLAPILAAVDAERGTWMAAYLPAYSLLLALLGPLAELLMPALAAGCVLLIGGCAQALWNDRRATNAATLLLASSPQLLINAMTAYPLAGNLFLNLLWLRLLLAPSQACALLLGPVSAFALLFHQPVPHALFVLPLGLGVVLRRKHSVGILAWHALWVGAAAWAIHASRALIQSTEATSGLSMFGVPSSWDLLIQSINVSMLLTWLSAPVLLLLPLALRRDAEGRRPIDHPFVAELGFGALLCLGFYFLFRSHQGHGWGYRYFFPLMGNAVLLAVAGFRALRQRCGAPAALPVVVGALASLALLLPLRASQVASFIAPYAAADRAISTSGAPIVLIQVTDTFYGWDLVRNDPFLRNETKRVHAEALGPARRAALDDRALLLLGATMRERFGLLSRDDAASLILRRPVRSQPQTAR